MNSNFFKVRCTQCKQTMMYHTKGPLKGKKKRCVYCGRTFGVQMNRV